MSSLRLCLLAHVETRHDYFADGCCRAMHFTPSPPCSEWMAAFELLLRSNAHSMSLHVPEHRLADLWQELQAQARRSPPPPLTLDFSVHSSAPGFAWYTEDEQPRTLRIPLGDPASDQAGWLASLGQRYTLQWHSRHSIWCYWLLGEWDEKVLSIVDTQGSRAFDALGLSPLDPAQALQAHCFRSQAPLALRERAPTGLQLRAGHTAAATRVVVSQLPAPRPSALQYENGPNGRQAVSEIFVSR
jgi:hypothetical protein